MYRAWEKIIRAANLQPLRWIHTVLSSRITLFWVIMGTSALVISGGWMRSSSFSFKSLSKSDTSGVYRENNSNPGKAEAKNFYTKETEASFCPIVITAPAQVCSGAGTIQLTATPAGGSWTVTAYLTSTGLFDPALASIGLNAVTYNAPCSPSSATVNIEVIESPVIFDFLIPAATSCAGDSSGEIVNGSFVTGGTFPYVYDWDNADTPGNDVFTDDGNNSFPHGLSGVPEGTYYFIATDALGCSDTVSAVVPPGPVLTAILQIDSIDCFGGLGNIQIISSTGPPVTPTYNWDNAGTIGDDMYGSPDPEDLIGVIAGTYYVTITYEDPGFFSCEYIDTIVLTEPTQVMVSVPSPVIPCFGASTSITATGSGGISPYMYNWAHIPSGSPPNDPATITVSVGTYFVTVTDANGCTNTAIANVTQNSQLMASATAAAVDCDDNSGSIDLTVTGGTPNYTYDWDAIPGTSNPEDPTGLNSGIYTVTVTDANGCTTTTSVTIVLNPPTFTMPPDDGTTVPCISDAQVVPTPPVVLNNCGDPLTITGPVVSSDPACSGIKTYTFTYTEPTTMQMAQWVYTYTILTPTFSLPAGGSSTVSCPANATVPTPPTVMDNCGNTITPSAGVPGADPACGGTKTWTFTYTNCDGSTQDWVYTYTINPPTITLPAPGASTVNCVSNATAPVPPSVSDNCGTPITPSAGVPSADPACGGVKTWTFTYTTCNGTNYDWVYTYTINPPTITLPAPGSSTVACPADAVLPTAPTVMDNCGNTITPSAGVPSADPACNGTKTWTFTYTNCDGTTQDWVYTYTISPPVVSMPAGGSSTVDCPAAATAPSPPAVLDNCGRALTPSAGVPSADPACGGPKTWTFTYTACDGTTYPWVYTYTINPPFFSLPAGGASTVNCPSDATAPTPPTVMDNCGNTITPSAGVPSADPACGGPKTWTFTYTNCDGSTQNWVYTYTINPPTFSLPAPGSSTVDCPADATAPTPPPVVDNCGNTITPSAGVPSPDPACGGVKTWTFTYTNCDGSTQDWVYTYTINVPTISLPAPGASTVDCPADATAPTPPTVMDNCGNTITPSAGVPSADPACGGPKTWTFTYTNCDGSTQDWVYTYTINPPTITLPAPGASTVDCPTDATAPTPPVVTDNCGNPITPSAGVPSADPPCGGPKTWTFTYTGCDGTTYDWVYTYTINPPTITLPAPGSSTVDCPADAVAPTPPTVMDNCGNTITPSAGVPSADPACGGPKTWTFTYTNCDGSTQNWVYTYTINPPFFSLPPGGASTVNCPADAVAPTPPTVMDNCGNTITPSAGVPSADPVCGGPKTWTFTYTNCDGSTQNWVYTYTITPPTFSLPAPGSSTVDCPTDATAPTPPPVTDNCGNTVTPSAGVPSADPACGGPKTWTFTYTNCDGTTQDWVYTYTINPPTFSLPAPGSSTVDCPADATTPTPPTVMDNCGNTITPSAGVPSADPACGGPKTWTFTYTNCDGSTQDWVYTYTINVPTIILPAPGASTVDCPGDATAPTPPVVMDNCGNTITPSAGVPSADPACGGPKTWTFTYTNCDGSTQDWVYTYTINPPTITLPAPGASTVDCPTDATAPTPPVVTDNCGNPITPSAGVPSADPACGGPKTWTFTYTGCDGTTYDWVYTYTINPPFFSLPPGGSSTVDCAADAVAPTPPTVMDNCGNTITPSPGVPSIDPTCAGTKTWTFTYTNCDGSTQDWVYTYTVNPPTVVLPAPGSSTVDCASDATAPTPPTVMDNCGNTLTPSAGVPSADPACGGPKTWTFTYTACDGMTYDWVYTYTINPPTFTLPAPGASTVDCPTDATAPTPPPVTDNCGNTVTPSAGVPSADPACGGPKTWTFTYTNCDGTTQDWVYTYTINPPTFSLPAPGSSTVDCPADATAPTPPTVMDNCGNTITPSAGVPSADPACGGPKTWTFTYTNCDGSTQDWVYTYTINVPTIILPAPGASTVDCPGDATAPTPPTVMDNCGNTITPSAGVPSADPACGGPKTWTFTYTNCDGSTQDWVYTYTINPPTITLPAPGASTVDCPTDATAPTPPVVTDNCGNPITPSAGVPSADPACGGPKTWTFTYTGCDGTTYDWVYTYTINPPFFSLPPGGSSTVDCAADAVAPTPPTVMDNCGNTITPSPGVPSIDPTCAGTKTWTFTYTNCDGSTQDWVYTYTVNPPTVVLPAPGSSTVDCASDATAPTPPTVMDNCGNTLTPSAGVPSADPVCGGPKTWTFTYTACDGMTYDWVYTYTINPPTFTLPAPGASTVDCPTDATAPTPPPVTDNCGNTVTPSAGVPSADPACGGPKTWTFTYTNCDGTTQDWVYIYTINPPTITLPAPGSSTVDCPADATAPTPPVVMDNCGNTITPSAGVPSADPVCGGPKTWTFTYTNCDGSTQDWVYTYTINVPTIILPAPGASTVDCPGDATAPTPPVVMDNCGNTITPSAGVPSADPACGGPKTWTFTYTNCDGSTQDWVYTYTINPPTITLPAPGASTVDCPGDATAPTPPVVTDNCGNPITPSAGVPSADPACGGPKTWTFTYTGCDGTTYDWVYTYTINPPFFTLPAGGSSTVDCAADAVAPTPPTVMDNCGNTITPSPGVPSIDPTCAGTKTWTFTYTNCDGSTQDWVYTYTVNPPTVVLPAPGSSTVDCASDATAPTPPTVMDNCGNTLTPSAGVPSADPACGGPKTWTFTYTACDGMTYDWVYTYTINPPIITLPAPGSSTVDCVSDAVAPTPPVVMDNCGNTVTPSAGVAGPDPACGGPKTWTFTYTNCDGTTQDWVYTYTINPPTVTLPAPGASTVDCPADATAPTPPVVMDNCGNTITPSAGVPSADPLCGGPKTWTFTYTGCDGTTYDWVYTYTVNPPTITLPAPGSSTVDCAADALEPTPPSVMDNCGAPITPGPGVPSIDPTCAGTKTWTFTYTACDGTTYDWVYTYTINAPTVTLPAPGSSTVDCPADATAPTPPVVMDNCGNTLTPSAGVAGADPVCGGPKTWTFTYTACDGMTYDWVYTFTINIPSITLPPPGSSTVDCVADAVAPTPPVVTDNCGNPVSPSAGVPGADPACGGTKIWTFTYTNCDGSTQDWIYTYTINIPTVTLPPGGASTVECTADAIEPVPPAVTDNCGNPITPSAGVPGPDPTCGGTKTWTFTYTDCDGNDHDWVYTYTVNDLTPPVMTCPADISFECVGSIPPAYTTLTEFINGGGPVSDNCGLDPTTFMVSEVDNGTCPRTITRTYSIEDSCGNVAQCQQMISIDDPTPPVITCPADPSFECIGDVPPASATITDFINAGGTISDNCGVDPASFMMSESVSGSCPTTITRTYSIADSCGNINQCVQTITVNDVTPPSITCPADGSVECFGDVTPAFTTFSDFVNGGGMASDNCGLDESTFGVTETSGGTCPITITRTYSIADSCGNMNQCVQTITVNDATLPVITCPAGQTVECIGDVPAAFATLTEFVNGGGSASDNCGLDPASFMVMESESGTCPRLITRTYSIADSCGNVNQCVQTITVEDITPPTLTCPADQNAECISDVLPAYATLADLIAAGGTVSDNCGLDESTFTVTSSESGVCPRIMMRTYSVADSCGNIAQCMQTITVEDLTDPVMTCPSDQNFECIGDLSPAFTNLTDFLNGGGTVTDNCGLDPATFTASETDNGLTCPRTISRTYSIEDSCGNVAQCVQTITINDITPPALTCPGDISFECVGNIPAAFATLTDFINGGGTASDNCGLDESTFAMVETDNGTCPRTITRTYSIEDSCGNLAQCIQTITVDDPTPPAITCPADQMVECASDVPPAFATLTDFISGLGSVSDNCGLDPASFMVTESESGVCPRTIIRTYSIADSCGNVAQCVHTITVDDTTLPVLTCPADVAVECFGEVPPAATTLADFINDGGTVSDNCGLDEATFMMTESSGGVCPITITRTYSIADSCGNISQCVQTISVSDATPPAISCPADASFECIGDLPAAYTTLPDFIAGGGTVSDNCGLDPASFMVSESDNGTCPRIIMRTYSIADSCGNVNQCVQTITIEDITLPSLLCPADQNVECYGDVPPAFVTLTDFIVAGGSASDNCGLDETTFSVTETNSGVCPRTVTRVYSVADTCGNVAQCTQIFTVQDITDPMLVCPADINVECIGDIPAAYATLTDFTNAGGSVSDNCGLDQATFTYTELDDMANCPRTVTRTYSIADSCGNVAQCVQQIVISDVVPPVVVCPPDQSFECTASLPAAFASLTDFINGGGSVSDNCGLDPASFTLNETDDGLTCPRTITRTYSISDSCGNMGQCIQTFLVDDTILPVITCPADQSVECVGDLPVAFATLTDFINGGGTASDNCALDPGSFMVNETNNGSCPIIITRTYSIADSCGNISQCVQTLTVADATLPVVTCPGDATFECIGDVPPAFATLTDYINGGGTASDNCGLDPATFTVTEMDDMANCPRTITRTYAIADSCGNIGQCIQTITISDVIPPTASNPSSLALSGCNTPVPPPDISVVIDAADNCGVPVVAFVGDMTDLVGCTETTTRTYSVTDACNNSITVEQIIVRTVDTTPPVFTNPPADLTVECIAQVPPMTDLDYTDNCSPAGVVMGVETGPSGNPLTIVRTWTITDDCGNAATVTQTITINDANQNVSITEDLCPGETVTINGVLYDTPGMYLDTFPGMNGECDTFATITINGLPYNTATINADLCPGDTVIINGEIYTMGGTYMDTLPGVAGECDTILTIEIMDIGFNTATVSADLCPGDTVIINGEIYTMGGTYMDTLPGIAGECDTLLTIQITDIGFNTATTSADICPGDTVIINGEIYTMGGTYMDTLPGIAGECDTLLTIQITELPLNTTTINANLCPGDTLIINGEIYTMGGTYMDTLSGVAGECDTALTIQITDIAYNTNTISADLCPGDTLIINGEIYTMSGTFTDTLPGVGGECDTILTIQISPDILPENTIMTSFCEGGSVTVYGVVYDMEGTYFDTITSQTGGCDTAVTIIVTEMSLVMDTIDFLGCEGDGFSITVNGNVYDESNPMGDETLAGQSGDCDTLLHIDLVFEPQPVASITPAGPVCTDAAVITLMASPPGGVWSGDVTNDQFDPGALGTGVFEIIYTVTVGSCQDADTINITVYELTVSCLTVADESAPGANDGQGQVTVSGGMPPYMISWTGPASGSTILNQDGSFDIINLPAGVYTVEVEDASGCFTSCQFTIMGGMPCDLMITAIDPVAAACSGVNNGSVTITAAGSMPPFEYSLDGINYQPSNFFDMLAPGSYTAFVQDAMGCEEMQAFNIGVGPGADITNVLTENAVCGQNNGSIEVEASGGSVPYTYSIDGVNYGLSPLFPGLGAGMYTIYLIDNAGCTDTAQATIMASGSPMINGIILDNASCGQPDGSITINASGGVPPLEYSIDGGMTFQASNFFGNLPAGTYDIVVRDAAGCEVFDDASIIDEGGPMASATTTPTSCGADDGSITVDAVGTPTLMYSLTGPVNRPFQSSNVFNNLPAGNYVVTVRDGNNCQLTLMVTVNTTNGPVITDVDITHTECGENNGEITVTASGGTGELEYFFNGVSNQDDPNKLDLAAGMYLIEVVDENGCSASMTVTIDPSDGPGFDVYITPAHCGLSDGIIELDGFGGQPPYTYSINGGAFTPSFTFVNRPSDFYIMTIRDANGCEREQEVFLWEDDEPEILSITVTDPDCGQTNGTIEVEAEGDGLMYSFRTPPVYQMTNILTPVPPGTYTITVKDEYGCIVTGTATVNPRPNPSMTVLVMDSECGMSTGSIDINASGGITPYSYSIDGINYGPNDVFNNLPAGNYTAYVQGANGCIVSQDVMIDADGAQFGSFADLGCAGDDYLYHGNTYTVPGTYSVTLQGGAANGCDSIITLTLSSLPLEQSSINETICEGEVYTYNGTDYTITGTYVLDTLTAAVGCDTVLSLLLTVDQPDTLDQFETICNGGVFTYNGIDYTTAGMYVIDTFIAAVGCDSILILHLDVSDFNRDTLPEDICIGEIFTYNGMDYATAGIYTLDTLAGPGGCDTILYLNLSVHPLPTVDAGPDQQLDCQVQTVTLMGSGAGGNPSWTGPDINAGNQNLFAPEVGIDGQYILTVTSAQGCVDMDTVVVTLDPSTVIANAGPDDSLTCEIDTIQLQGGPAGPNLVYLWSGPGINASNQNQMNPIITVPGTYTLVVTDTMTGCVSAPDDVVISLYAPNIVAIIQNPNTLDCYSTFIDLDATGSSAGPTIIYIWFDEEGNIVGNSSTIEITTGGMFVFVVKDTLSGCFADDTVFVEDLTAYPPVEAGDPGQIDCNNPTDILNEGATNGLPNIIFQWTGPPGGILSPDTLLSITVGVPGFYYYLTATDTVTGCQRTDSAWVEDLTVPPIADIDILENITCVDSTALLDIGVSSAGPGITYSWSGPGVNGMTSTSIEPNSTGTYMLTVFNSATGCEASATVMLDAPMVPGDMQASLEIPVCAGDPSGSITVTQVTGGTPPFMYALDGGPAQLSPVFDSLTAGDYVVTVIDANGCTYSEAFSMPDGIVLTINIGQDIELELGDSITLWADVSLPWSQIDSIVWDPASLLSCTHCINPVLYGLNDALITATVYTSGCVDMDQLALNVNVEADIYIPNVFSPNDDGINDHVTVFTDHRVRKVVYLEIFDRWGNLVFIGENFEPNDPLLGWDGSFRGKKMNPAVFAYIAKVELLNGATVQRKGDITLIR